MMVQPRTTEKLAVLVIDKVAGVSSGLNGWDKVSGSAVAGATRRSIAGGHSKFACIPRSPIEAVHLIGFRIVSNTT
jgi:hypothetical protein